VAEANATRPTRRLTTVRLRLTLLRLPLQATAKPLRFVRLRSCTISSPSRHGTRFRFYSVEEQERTPNLREMGAAITTADTVSPEFCFRNSLRNQHSCLASPCTVWCFPTTHYPLSQRRHEQSWTCRLKSRGVCACTRDEYIDGGFSVEHTGAGQGTGAAAAARRSHGR